MTAIATSIRLGSVLQEYAGHSGRRKRRVGLFFPRETWALHSKFRSRALHILYWNACEELGRRTRTATVSTWNQPGEPNSDHLLLTVAADVTALELESVRGRVLTAISMAAEGWTEEERLDYSTYIYFELVPLRE